ncbi:glycosyltransferase [Chryseobacterium gambrini]|uniref:Glycosyltransferase n=1 Tax=Chryseobacterium gambrini TaxID=373672 RepID=A0AAJ1R1Z4_9FLAO|nr:MULTISPECIES: glycosyltransferase [Chryseobacterium]MDN4012416.1 glycosyltransferase [Chryseobacterium gambrini]QWA37419.1 glycosyltransferase [Chryseobacterium sp. ZHDP1]
MRKKILFVLHEATRSGAPILLLELLKEIQNAQKYEVDLLILLNGTMAKDFTDLVPAAVNIKHFQPRPNIVTRILRRFIVLKNDLLSQEDLYNTAVEKLSAKNYHCVFGMTVATLSILEKFKAKGLKTILYTHELQFALESFYDAHDLSRKISSLDSILAGSQSVKDFLTQRYKISAGKISVAYSFISKDNEIKTKASELRQQYNISDDTFILGTLSTQELRKGSELVPLLAKKIKQKTPNLKFKIFNIGGNDSNPFVRFAKIDTQKLDVEEEVIFVENTKNPNDYVNIFDCFLLPSREDPFPLVMHLAAEFNKPIVGFKDSGGVEEFLNGTNLLADYLDIDQFADIIIKTHNDKIFREKSLLKIKDNVHQFSKENSMITIYNVIDNI